MAGNIKGITIKLGANATELTQALRTAESNLSRTQKSLNDVNKALKFDPNNTVLLAQKQELLTRKISDTKDKLETLKQTLSQMEASGVDKTSDDFMEVQRAVVVAESQLRTFNAQLKEVTTQNSQLGQLGAQFETVGSKLTSAGQAMKQLSIVAAAVATSIAAAAVSAGIWADDLNTASSVTGIATKDLQMYAAAADLVDVSAETIGKSMARMKKNMLSAAEGTGTAAETFAQLGVSITNADGSLRDQNAVFNETIKKLGEMENETERDALAMTIFGKSAAQLNPMIEDMGETYAAAISFMEQHGIPIVDQETLDQANKFNDAIDNIKMVFTQAVNVIGSKLAGVLAPMMENIADKLATIAGWVANLNPKILAVVGALSAMLAVVAPLLLGVGSLVTLVGKILPSLQGILTFLAPIKTALAPILAFCTANPLLVVVAALVALSAGLVATGTSVDEFANKIVSFATNAINNLLAAIPQIITAAGQMIVSFVQGLVDNIPLIIETGLNLIMTLAQALIDNLPLIIDAAMNTINALVQGLIDNMPQLIQMGITLIGALAMGIIKAIPTLIANMPQVISGIVSGLTSGLGQLADVGINIIKGLWNGAAGMVSWAVDKFKGIGTSILDGIKSALGIKSPSKKFAEVGKYSMQGLAKGIEDNLKSVQGAMTDVQNTMLAPDLTLQSQQNGSAMIGDSVANAINSSMAIAGSGQSVSTINLVVELGGTKVAEQIYKLNKQGQMALQG